MIFSIEELVVGKPYICFLKREKEEFKLSWGSSKQEIVGQIFSSIFIFIELAQGGYGMKDYFTIKALVDGKLLYAPGCDGPDFYFEEIK